MHRRDIFDRIWTDVIVSDSALSQAIRTIRRVLGDDSREPRFVRTVSRHGYRFVFADVVEEDDEAECQPTVSIPPVSATPPVSVSETYESLLQRVTGSSDNASEEEEQREAAELLHALGHGRGAAASWHSSASSLCARVAERHPVGCRRSRCGTDSRRARAVCDRARARQTPAAPRGRPRRCAMGQRVAWRRPGGRGRRDRRRIDPHGGARQRRVACRCSRARHDRRSLRRARRRGRGRGAVGRRIDCAIVARDGAGLRRRGRRWARGIGRPVDQPMEPCRARRREPGRRRRHRRSRDWSGRGTWLHPCHPALARVGWRRRVAALDW